MADKQCKHGLGPGQCSECQPRPQGMPIMVCITKEGEAFHRYRDCPALIAGQRYADRVGQRTHEPEMVSYATARASGRSACLYCFPQR
jgi:hypothetical protein